MAGKSRYTDEDKARVLALLEANKGNVKRTNRETGVAEQTIRDWKKQAEREELTAPVVAALPAAREDVAKQMEGIRDKMLENLEAKVLNDELSGKDLLVGICILTEKLLLLRGRQQAERKQQSRRLLIRLRLHSSFRDTWDEPSPLHSSVTRK